MHGGAGRGQLRVGATKDGQSRAKRMLGRDGAAPDRGGGTRPTAMKEKGSGARELTVWAHGGPVTD